MQIQMSWSAIASLDPFSPRPSCWAWCNSSYQRKIPWNNITERNFHKKVINKEKEERKSRILYGSICWAGCNPSSERMSLERNKSFRGNIIENKEKYKKKCKYKTLPLTRDHFREITLLGANSLKNPIGNKYSSTSNLQIIYCCRCPD